MTVGLTRIEVSELVERALARVGVQPEQQTPDAVYRAQVNLSLQLARFASKGLYPWQINHRSFQLIGGQAGYKLPLSVVDVLNVNRRQVTLVSGTDSMVSPIQRVFTPDSPSRVVMVSATVIAATNGLKNNITIETIGGAPPAFITRLVEEDVWQEGVRWFEVDNVLSTAAVRVTLSGTGDAVLAATQLVSETRDVPLGILNRTDWANQPSKSTLSTTPTVYFFDKQAEPIIYLWLTPQDSTYLLWVEYQHHGIDLPKLYETIAIPTLHLDGLIDQLSLRLAKELPGKAPKLQVAKGEAAEAEADNNAGASDGAPVRIMPNVRRYTR